MAVTFAATQFACSEDATENLGRAERLVREAAGRGAQNVTYWTNTGVGNTNFGVATNRPGTPYFVNLGRLAAGYYNIYASATDAGGAGATVNSPTNSLTLADPIAISLMPTNGATVDYDVPVTATAAVAGGMLPYSAQFYLDGVASGAPLVLEPYARSFGTLFVGDHTIKAAVTDARGWVSNSLAHTVHITGPLGVVLTPTNGASFLFGQPVTLEAAPGGGTAPYVVTLYTNDQPVLQLLSLPSQISGSGYTTPWHVSH